MALAATLHGEAESSDVDPEQLLAQEPAAASRAIPRRSAAIIGALLLGLAAALVALRASGGGLESTSSGLFQQKFGHGHGGQHGGPMHGGAHMPRGKLFEDSDTDKNGQLEGGELASLAAGLKERLNVTDADFQEEMKAADKNGDGKLAMTEIPLLIGIAHKDSAARKRFSLFDQDHNGKVEGDELEDLTKKMEDHFGLGDKEFQAALTAADKNKDGKLEGDEAAAFLAEVHKDAATHHQQHHGQGHRPHTFDHDGDGKLQGDELKELKAMMLKRFKLDEAHLEAALKDSDKNGDGVLEQAEMPLLLQKLHGSQMAGKSFHKYDADGNGNVEGKELENMKAQMKQHFKIQESDFLKMFQAADSNKDGKLEEDEAPVFLQELHKAGMDGHSQLSWMDKDKNGLVEGQELKVMEKRLRAHHKVTDAEFNRIVAEADENGDGKLAKSEIHKLMAGLHKESVETHRADAAIKRLADQLLGD